MSKTRFTQALWAFVSLAALIAGAVWLFRPAPVAPPTQASGAVTQRERTSTDTPVSPRMQDPVRDEGLPQFEKLKVDILAGPVAAELTESELARLGELFGTIAHEPPSEEEEATSESVLPLYFASEDDRDVVGLAQEIARGQLSARSTSDNLLRRDFVLASMLLVELIAHDGRLTHEVRENAYGWLRTGLDPQEITTGTLLRRMDEVLGK